MKNKSLVNLHFGGSIEVTDNKWLVIRDGQGMRKALSLRDDEVKKVISLLKELIEE